jgi:hypothetical protein
VSKLEVGQVVVAVHDVHWPGLGLIAARGSLGEVVAVGPDRKFGYANVRFKGSADAWMLPIAPHCRPARPAVEVITESEARALDGDR